MFNLDMALKQYFSNRREGLFPLDTRLLRCVSAMAAELIGFTLVYVLIFSRSTALRVCSIPAPAVRSLLEQILYLLLNLADAGARRSNSAEFCTEQTGSQAPK